MAPPMTVASEQKTTTRRPFTRPTAASIPESYSWVASVAPEGDGHVGTAEAEGVVQSRDVTRRQVAGRGRDVELDLGVEVVEVDRRGRHPAMDRQDGRYAFNGTATTE